MGKYKEFKCFTDSKYESRGINPSVNKILNMNSMHYTHTAIWKEETFGKRKNGILTAKEFPHKT